MNTTAFALIFGIAFTLAGILGMFPAALTPPPADAPATTFTVLYGYLLGLFPVNVLHSAAHLAIGIAGLAAASSEAMSRRYAQALALIYGLLGVMGLLPQPFNTVFGLIPVHGHDVWLHLGTAAVAAYFGWRSDIPVLDDGTERRMGLGDRRQAWREVAYERRKGSYDRRMPLGT
ncbi:MAG TPA: DUF4383 domain-containing protein [Burkholderiales bacterium]